MDGIPNFLMKRHRSGLLLAFHETLRDFDFFRHLAPIPHIFDSERKQLADAKAGMHSHQDYRDIACAITALTGLKKADNFIFAQRAASTIIHAKKIRFPLKAAGFQEIPSHKRRNRYFCRKKRFPTALSDVKTDEIRVEFLALSN